tara:strand:- start:3619 stop:3816 length:198 start_codon:yes stop_codon:yes gene_type:complete
MKTAVCGLNNRYFLSVNQTCDLIGLSRTTLWRKEQRGEFPKKVLLSPMRKGYRTSDIEEWMEGLK